MFGSGTHFGGNPSVPGPESEPAVLLGSEWSREKYLIAGTTRPLCWSPLVQPVDSEHPSPVLCGLGKAAWGASTTPLGSLDGVSN